MNQEYIGIDLGGTSFNVGRVKSASVIAKTSNAVNITISESELLTVLQRSIDSLFTSEVKGIGIGVPGIVDPVSGIIYDIQNIPAWQEVPLQQILEEKYRVPVSLNNDANCFALGEKKFGKGVKYGNFVGLSIGTGLGMGIIINDQLYSGVMCGAGEIGMIPYKDSIIEQYAGSFYFMNHYKKSAKEVHEMALRSHPQALADFEDFGRHLGEAIKIILFMYAPEAIILGGSISKAYPFFKESMETTIATFAYPKQIENLSIEVSTQPDLPILGAAALCFEKMLSSS
ncbi:MAG: ROK family protein [Bacteroidetes bacterium]|nr:MAG: ROK family protein [Bacteroidota bacterium]